MLFSKKRREMDSEKVNKMFCSVFQNGVVLLRKLEGIERKGWFLLEYSYPSCGYCLSFECENASFCIRVTHGDFYTSLMQIEQYDNTMCEENVMKALSILQSRLQNKIYFYTIQNGHRYQQTESGQLKRIR